MDGWTVVLSAASSLLGALVGSYVTWRIAGDESRDRRDTLSLEREKWDHERAQPDWAKEDAAYEAVRQLSDGITSYANRLEGYGISDPVEHDGRMTELLETANRAVGEVNLHGGSSLVHYVAVSMVKTFHAWVYAWQTDDPEAERLRALLVEDQRMLDRSVKRRLRERRGDANAASTDD